MSEQLHIVYFDTETQRLAEETELGFEDPPAMGLSLMCSWDSASRQYRTFMEHNIIDFGRIIEKADLVIGHNIKRFDLLHIQPFFEEHEDDIDSEKLEINLLELPAFDMMERVIETYGKGDPEKRLSLDNLAKNTLGIRKLASGEAAVGFWKRAEMMRLEMYCRQDVKITKEVFEFACKEKFLRFFNPETKEDDILDTHDWADIARQIVSEYKEKQAATAKEATDDTRNNEQVETTEEKI